MSHDWEVSESGMKINDIDTNDYDQGSAEHVLMATEAERLIEELSRFELRDVGSSRWLTQHAIMEKLNQQAHASARDKSDEFVLESILTFEKLPLLIYDLVLSEAWRELIFPRLESTICAKESPRTLRAYFVLYHEATIVNLLEVLCFHSYAVAAMKDAAVDLIDYCARRLATLQGRADEFRSHAFHGRRGATTTNDNSAKAIAQELATTTPQTEMKRQLLDIEFSISIACIGMIRYLSQHLGELTVSAVTRLLDHHDMLLSVVPLIENPPWTRMACDEKTKKRGWQKFEQGSWQSVPRNRLLQLTKLEAQAWLALFALVMHPQVRKRYGFNSFRKATLLRARKYLNELILDQLPALADLQRFMDELAIVDTPEPTAFADRAGGSGLLLEQVAALRDRAIGKQDLDKVAQHQIKFIWNKDNLHLDKTDLSHLVDIYSGPDDAAFGQEKEGQSVQELLERLRIENNKSVPKVESLTEEKKQIALQEVSSRPLPGKTETDPTQAAVNTKSSKPLVQVLDDDKKNEHLPKPPPRSNKPGIVEVDHSTTDEPIVEDITTSVSAVEEVVQEKKIDSIVPPEQPPSHDNEVTSVELQLRDKTILLIRQAESKIVPSPDGRHFQRVKWVPASPLLISFRDSLTLRVRLSMETTPKLISLDFYNELAEHFDPPPLRKIWHQIGDVEDDLAAQLFLILQPREPSALPRFMRFPRYAASTPISIIPGINLPE